MAEEVAIRQKSLVMRSFGAGRGRYSHGCVAERNVGGCGIPEDGAPDRFAGGGERADMVAVNGNLLDDITAVRWAVFRGEAGNGA